MNSTKSITAFIQDMAIPWESVAVGVKRKIMAWDQRLMLVRVAFDKDGIGSLHKHHHSQITHVESGVFEVEIGGEKRVLKAGDVFIIPSNVLHGAVCLEEGVLIDVFSPMREDFVNTDMAL